MLFRIYTIQYGSLIYDSIEVIYMITHDVTLIICESMFLP